MAEDKVNEQESLLGSKRAAKKQDEGSITLTTSELQKTIAEAVAAAVAQSSQASARLLAEAMQELKKPYIDPAKEENDRRQREQMKALNERLRRNLELDRINCPHLQGSNALSEEQGTRLSIAWHRLDTGVQWGICTNCQREFWPSDPDYRQWRARKSGNRPSQAGQRDFVNTKEWESQEHPVPFGTSVQ